MGHPSSECGRTRSRARLGPPSRERLQELIALAQVYRGWSIKELAQFVGRDPHNMVPGSGVPKLDLVIGLAEALDWPIGDLVEDLCSPRESTLPEEPPPDDRFLKLNRASYYAHIEGRVDEALEAAIEAYAIARTPRERAEAGLRELLAYEGLGRFQNAAEAASRAFSEPDLPVGLRLRLRNNLANAYFSLGRFVEGEGVASCVLQSIRKIGALTPDLQTSRAYSLYVRGQCRRLRLEFESDLRSEIAASARDDFVESRRQYGEIVESTRLDAFAGISHTCEGAILLLDVILGNVSVSSGLEQVQERLERAVDLSTIHSGNWVETYGWWSLFGCQMALLDGIDHDERQRLLAIFTNKAYEVAEQCGDWALRERVFTLDFVRRTRFPTADPPPVLDEEEIKVLAGTMGRFPHFRDIGWQLLRGIEGA